MPAEVESLRSAFQTGGWKAYQETKVKIILLPRAMSPCAGADLGLSYLSLGDLTEALRWLNQQVDERCAIPPKAADPRFDPIRSDPRFIAVLKRMNFPHEH